MKLILKTWKCFLKTVYSHFYELDRNDVGEKSKFWNFHVIVLFKQRIAKRKLSKGITMQSPLNVSNPSEKEVILWDHDAIPKICSNEPGVFKNNGSKNCAQLWSFAKTNFLICRYNPWLKSTQAKDIITLLCIQN